MKIAHLSETFLPRIGGIETALSTLFRHTPDVEHVVLTNPWSTAPRFEAVDRNVIVRRVPPDDALFESLASFVPFSRWSARMAHGTQLFLHLLREANRRQMIYDEHPPVDVVHIHSAARARYFLNFDRKHGLRIGKRLLDWWLDISRYPAPVLFTDHSLFGGTPDQFHATFAGEVVRRFPSIVCVERSGFENATAYSRDHRLGNRIWHVPNPVDTTRFRFDPLPQSPPLIVGHAGRADKSGVAEIIRMAQNAPSWIQFRFALAGIPPIDLPPIPKSARVEWNVSYDSMPAFYAGIHVFLDSFSFGLPRTVLEALASGRIVLRLRTGPDGSEELPTNVSPLVPRRSAEVLAFLEELAADRMRLERISQQSRSFAEQTFDARIVANQYRKIYQEIGR